MSLLFSFQASVGIAYANAKHINTPSNVTWSLSQHRLMSLRWLRFKIPSSLHSALQLIGDHEVECDNVCNECTDTYLLAVDGCVQDYIVLIVLRAGLTFSSCCQGEEKDTSFHMESSQRSSVKEIFWSFHRQMSQTHMLQTLFIYKA